MGLSALLFACAVCAAPAKTPDVPAPTVAAASTMALDASVDVRVGGLDVGEGAAARRVDERRVEPRLGFSPVAEVRAWVGVPFLFRAVARGDDERDVAGVGDVEVGADTTLVDDREGLRGSLVLATWFKLPTAPVSLDPVGDVLPASLQAGCASIAPAVSIAYAFGERGWDVRAAAAVFLPFAVRAAPHRGASVTVGADASMHPVPALSLRIGSRLSLEASGEDEDGTTEPDSGGVVHYVSAGVDASYEGLVAAGVSVDVPLGNALRGDQAPTPILGLRASGRWAL